MLQRGIVALLLCGSAMMGTARIALADNPPGYDVETTRFYCTDGSQQCNQPSDINHSMYIEAQAVSFTPGQTSGTPDAVDLTCGHTIMTSNGPVAVADHVFATTSPMGPQFGYDPGTISGNVSIRSGNPTEANTQVQTTFNVQAYDPTMGDHAVAHGVLTTNNVTDTKAGNTFMNGVKIHEWGTVHYEPLGPGPSASINAGAQYFGISCTSNGPTVMPNPSPAPFDEAVVNNSDND